MTIHLHRGDLPQDFKASAAIAIDTETMGLDIHRDRLCLVQLSNGDGDAHLVQIARGQKEAPNLAKILADPAIVKIFHFARFDLTALAKTFSVMAAPIYCTKIASKLARTYTDRHGLRELARELAGVDMSKQQQSSDWGAQDLSPAQMDYAASDVLYLHELREKLDIMLAREKRTEMARACFGFLPMRAWMDLAGFPERDIFSHE